MMKITSKVLIVLSMLFASVGHAALITNLTDAEVLAKDYTNAQDLLTADKEGINFISFNGWDYAWASPVSTQNWDGNIFHAPELQKNWRVVDQFHLDIIKSDALGLASFTNQADGSFIHAISYWNTIFDAPSLTASETSDTTSGDFSGGLIVGGIDWYKEEHPLYYQRYTYFDAFYMRNVADRPVDEVPPAPPTDVPEPQSILIFALALIFLSLTNRTAKVRK